MVNTYSRISVGLAVDDKSGDSAVRVDLQVLRVEVLALDFELGPCRVWGTEEASSSPRQEQQKPIRSDQKGYRPQQRRSWGHWPSTIRQIRKSLNRSVSTFGDGALKRHRGKVGF